MASAFQYRFAQTTRGLALHREKYSMEPKATVATVAGAKTESDNVPVCNHVPLPDSVLESTAMHENSCDTLKECSKRCIPIHPETYNYISDTSTDDEKLAKSQKFENDCHLMVNEEAIMNVNEMHGRNNTLQGLPATQGSTSQFSLNCNGSSESSKANVHHCCNSINDDHALSRCNNKPDSQLELDRESGGISDFSRKLSGNSTQGKSNINRISHSKPESATLDDINLSYLNCDSSSCNSTFITPDIHHRQSSGTDDSTLEISDALSRKYNSSGDSFTDDNSVADDTCAESDLAADDVSKSNKSLDKYSASGASEQNSMRKSSKSGTSEVKRVHYSDEENITEFTTRRNARYEPSDWNKVTVEIEDITNGTNRDNTSRRSSSSSSRTCQTCNKIIFSGNRTGETTSQFCKCSTLTDSGADEVPLSPLLESGEEADDNDSVFESPHSSYRRHRTDSKQMNFMQRKLSKATLALRRHSDIITRRVLATVIKYALFVFNFLSWIVGAISIGMGLWIWVDKGKIVSDVTLFFMDPAIMIVVVGGITFVVAFLGCVGAVRENLILLKIFFVVLSVILVGEVVIGITLLVFYTIPEASLNIRNTPEQILKNAIVKYMDDETLKEWIDLIQREFRCCGISHTQEGFRDWQYNMYFNCSNTNPSIWRCAVPSSCCIFEEGDRINLMCGWKTTNKTVKEVRDYIFTRGCIHGFEEWLDQHDELIIITAVSILIMQFLAVLSAKVMVNRIERHRRRWRMLQRQSS